MCYVLHLASPVTLSEVRSMLPPGLAADPLPRTEAEPLRRLLPDAVTVARLLRGACSCDLLLDRDPVHHADERHLRARYAELGVPRDEVIRALERHRRGALPHPRPHGAWDRALAAFVAEHARCAGPSLYHLDFGPRLGFERPPAAPVTPVPLARVREDPEGWLVEAEPLLVAREAPWPTTWVMPE
ncbi:MAG TPA: hypothetical protein VFS40_06080 [Gemmatimonadales bacterium]|nr:hypothetical protein [Gemmatimonadales bacterium]